MWWGFLVGFVPPLSVMSVDTVTARTTLRLWHELYVAKKLAHDFQDVFDPRHGECVYVAGVIGDEIKAIAQCKSNAIRDVPLEELLLVRIACSPHCENIASEFVRLIVDKAVVSIDDTVRLKQPRWYVAYSFYSS